MKVISDTVEKEGFKRSGDPLFFKMDFNETAVLTWSPKGHRKLLIVTLGSTPLANADIAVSDMESGDIIVSDNTEDRRVALEFISNNDATYEVSVINKGARAQFITAFFVSESLSASVPFKELFELDPLERVDLEDAKAIAFSRGYEFFMRDVEPYLSRGELKRKTEMVRPDKCYLFCALGSAGVDSLSLRVSKDRTNLVYDKSSRSSAWVSYCPESDETIILETIVLAGNGGVELAGFEGSRGKIVPLPGPSLYATDTRSNLESKIESESVKLKKIGYGEPTALSENKMTSGERMVFDFEIFEPGCYRISVFTEFEVGASYMTIIPENDSSPSFSLASSRYPSHLPLCVDETARYRGNISLINGEGRISALLFRLADIETPRGVIDMPFPLREATAKIAGTSLTPLYSIHLDKAGDDSVWLGEVNLLANHCYAFSASTKSSTMGEMKLESTTTHEVRLWKGPSNIAIITYCNAKNDDKFSIRLVTTRAEPLDEPIVLIFSDEKEEAKTISAELEYLN